MQKKYFRTLINTAFVVALVGCSAQGTSKSAVSQSDATTSSAEVEYSYTASAILAGGCFWCIESDFEKLAGVGDVISGYSGGKKQNPTYRNQGRHIEVIKVPYDPSVLSYREIVDYHLRHIDPLDDGGQFCDRGYEYTTAIYYADESEKADAQASVQEAETILGQAIVTPIIEASKFWPAEDYHQDYYLKNPGRYNRYRNGCRRDARVEAIWGK